VIEENDGMLSYWSLKHPPGNPDFHHPDSFALELESAAGEARRVAPIINPPREKTSGE
jgi:hypothetical protein